MIYDDKTASNEELLEKDRPFSMQRENLLILATGNMSPLIICEIFNCQPHKLVKHTQEICRLLQTNCLSEFDHFVRLALKGLIDVK